ncbi:MAG TPA: D-alanyl-D-alanine carboxypeptidase family protein [Pyrinomonadaceae bacterium]|nr:D-alanyl-D-alanine carboxypeptidase family protein [Pyrinomonadaceae bacterium]
MKSNERKTLLICVVSLAALILVAGCVPVPSDAGDVARRDPSPAPSPARSPETRPAPSPAESSANSARAANAAPIVETVELSETELGALASGSPAAEQNRTLKDTLRWTFGGKQQRGWVIYVPLIQRLIGTDEDATTERFAASLARWQKRVGLAATGVLDEPTLMRMIQTWQTRRLRDRTYPQPDQLVTVSGAEFWDSSRAEDLRKVERQTYAAYKRMLAAAIDDSSAKLAGRGDELAASEKYLKIISAFRSREYQDRLRKLEPQAGRAALAVNSPHFTGRALDLYVGGEPTITKDPNRLLQTQTPAYRWLVRNAERFGFCPYFYEPWHWEYCAP